MTMNQTVQTGTATQIIERFAYAEARSMIRWFSDKTRLVFEPNVRIDMSPKRRGSWGGIRKFQPYISLALHKYIEPLEKNTQNHFFEEYASFANSPTIGSLTGNWAKCISAIVAHELAHAVQWYFKDNVHPNIRSALRVTAEVETGHGEFFRQLYRAFREQFVNYRDFNIQCVVIAEPQKAKAPPVPPKRAVKGITMKLSKGNKGWFIHKYYDAEGKLLGTMASKPGYQSQGLVDNKWVELKNPKTGGAFRNHTEAKKFFLKL